MTLTAITQIGSRGIVTRPLILCVLMTLTGTACNQANDNAAVANAKPANISLADSKPTEPAVKQAETAPTGREIKAADGPEMKSVIPPDDAVLAGVLNDIAVSLPKPELTAEAKAANASGKVTVEVLVNEKGEVVTSSVVSGPQALWSAAGAAARQAKFDPPLKDGKPVRVAGVLTYDFAK